MLPFVDHTGVKICDWFVIKLRVQLRFKIHASVTSYSEIGAKFFVRSQSGTKICSTNRS